jgi:hypothetical protein
MLLISSGPPSVTACLSLKKQSEGGGWGMEHQMKALTPVVVKEQGSCVKRGK